ncbi:hypothetical protein BO71DRAFT_114209 [Aspergillus ellipticus CBS 707.79]|uniref:Uncharacterized protein n=1 Tax=Aspergillus ellipticus CBS 707.79 TaxID=1448320 RepID=A0A319EA75_9EURO|nr:hypothetical protein BO71DRAFT_114209 [Aspergillus ellipticus CBS 707.79]
MLLAKLHNYSYTITRRRDSRISRCMDCCTHRPPRHAFTESVQPHKDGRILFLSAEVYSVSPRRGRLSGKETRCILAESRLRHPSSPSRAFRHRRHGMALRLKIATTASPHGRLADTSDNVNLNPFLASLKLERCRRSSRIIGTVRTYYGFVEEMSRFRQIDEALHRSSSASPSTYLGLAAVRTSP